MKTPQGDRGEVGFEPLPGDAPASRIGATPSVVAIESGSPVLEPVSALGEPGEVGEEGGDDYLPSPGETATTGANPSSTTTTTGRWRPSRRTVPQSLPPAPYQGGGAGVEAEKEDRGGESDKGRYRVNQEAAQVTFASSQTTPAENQRRQHEGRRRCRAMTGEHR